MITSPELSVGAVQLDHYTRHDCGCCSEFGFGAAVISPQLSRCGITTEDIDKELDKLKTIEEENATILRFSVLGTCLLMMLSFIIGIASIVSSSLRDSPDFDSDSSFEERQAKFDNHGPSLGNFIPFIIFGLLVAALVVLSCVTNHIYYNTIVPAWKNCINEINSQAPWVSAGVSWDFRETADLRQHGDDMRISRSYMVIIAPPSGNVAYTNNAARKAPTAPPAYTKRPQAGRAEVTINFCGQCGEKLNPNFKFCRHCGAKVDAEVYI